MSPAAPLITAVAGLLALVLGSLVIEALRPRPRRPDTLAWAPEIPVHYAEIGAVRVRYINTGSGPNLVLLHTLRTQLDLFQKVVAGLSRHFCVYACDYPGHGWSDIPRADYAPEDFYEWIAGFLERLDIQQATVAGVSIGGTISLALAARQNPRITRVIAVNPYDYWPAGGIRKSSLAARLILGPAEVPVLGSTLMRLRNRFVFDRIMEGGVASADALPLALASELYEVGNRPGQYQGFLNLLAHERRWPEARNEYPRIRIPVLLVYGEQDWAPCEERDRDRALIPQVTMETVPVGSHFLCLDRPQEFQDLIIRFAGGHQVERAAG